MYNQAKEKYAKIGVDTDKALERLSKVKISMHCWQGDDVKGFLFKDKELSGGIQTTGDYPGAARNIDELMQDITKAFSLIPGKHKLSLHSTYADAPAGTELNELEPKHFKVWVDFAKQNGLGLDFNPTCFSHEKADSGFTLSSADDGIRNFWIEHCKRTRKISEYFGKELGQKSVNNIWVPDGFKDIPVDRLGPRQRLKDALDEILSDPVDPKYHLDAVESKLFGIGSESYVVGSNEFYTAYAVKNNIAVTLDAGHFHPTEVISNKISSILLFTNELLLHVSRPVRWDSDHVVIMDDELREIALELVRNDLISRTHIGLDYFDASINRIAAWVIGMRNTQKALLYAMLEPTETLKKFELEGDYTSRLAWLEELKTMPFEAVWEHFLDINNQPKGFDWLNDIRDYEQKVTLNR